MISRLALMLIILMATFLSAPGDESETYPSSGHIQTDQSTGSATTTNTEGNGWTKTLGGSGEDFGNSIQGTSDGGFIITGTKDA